MYSQNSRKKSVTRKSLILILTITTKNWSESGKNSKMNAR